MVRRLPYVTTVLVVHATPKNKLVCLSNYTDDSVQMEKKGSPVLLLTQTVGWHLYYHYETIQITLCYS